MGERGQGWRGRREGKERYLESKSRNQVEMKLGERKTVGERETHRTGEQGKVWKRESSGDLAFPGRYMYQVYMS